MVNCSGWRCFSSDWLNSQSLLTNRFKANCGYGHYFAVCRGDQFLAWDSVTLTLRSTGVGRVEKKLYKANI